ncbi:TIGR03086 family metal-binding protein [Nocardiopsis ansamitocini]|uniref:Mycothiol-dependent maleylpyruvate isomerase metal-binding domain-containing protein n=1 Tax=Nocardiopsis ansamitocini TaxID=1670832 RepID=A0A9W6PA09_9ACTN|nr:TIGR03086 family metal-binding protein [Nocardiopsis ansamitocini]GLU49716.1 hypothetical protein Nans01_40670 [Nocardiopsis ansamitocini]
MIDWIAMSDRALLETSLDFATHRILEIGETPLSVPTPCSEWNLGQLLNHLVSSTALLADLVRGDEVDPRALAPERTAAVPFEGHPVGAFAVAAGTTRRVFASDEAWRRGVRMPGATMPAALVAKLIAMDAVVHGWDIARAVGADDTIPDPLAEDIMSFAETFVRPEVRGGILGPEVRVGAKDTKTRQLVAFLGRRP